MKKHLFLPFLLLFGISVSAQISINITNPTLYKLSGHNLFVQAKVTSAYEITSMVASTSGRQGAMGYNPTNSSYEAFVSLLGLNQGDTLLLTVTATDFFGNQNSATRLFIYDAPPELVIISPLKESVVRPYVNLKVKVVDKDSCNMAVYNSSNLIATYQNVKDSLVAILSLSAYNSSNGELKILAFDRKSQGNETLIRLNVETNAFLEEYKEVETKILDFNYNKILYNGNPSGLGYPKVLDITSNQISSIPFKIELSSNSYQLRMAHCLLALTHLYTRKFTGLSGVTTGIIIRLPHSVTSTVHFHWLVKVDLLNGIMAPAFIYETLP
jgi:hypothetical protein